MRNSSDARNSHPELDLLSRLLSRGVSRRTDGEARLRQLYPDAAEESLRSGAFHLYGELPATLYALLIDIELSLRDEGRRISEGLVWDAIYHLYNWLQLSAMLPWFRKDIFEQVSETLRALEGGDTDFAIKEMKRLRAMSLGDIRPPDIDQE